MGLVVDECRMQRGVAVVGAIFLDDDLALGKGSFQ
jgi:hypothetical protein